MNDNGGDDVLVTGPEELLTKIRQVASKHEASVISSALLSRLTEVDPRTIAAALRRFNVRPFEVEGKRVYRTSELVSLSVVSAVHDCAAGLTCSCRMRFKQDAMQILSAALGHDVRPVLEAAGLL